MNLLLIERKSNTESTVYTNNGNVHIKFVWNQAHHMRKARRNWKKKKRKQATAI